MTLSPRDAARLADACIPLAEAQVAAFVQRVQDVMHGAAPLPRRPRGRGSQLTRWDEMGVIACGLLFSRNPYTLARWCGRDPATVRRVLRSPAFQHADKRTSERVLERTLARRLWAQRRVTR